MDKQTKSGMPVDESKYSFTIPRTDEPREKILKLGAMITDRIGKVTGNDPEYWGLAGVVTDEMADVALKMKVRKPKRQRRSPRSPAKARKSSKSCSPRWRTSALSSTTGKIWTGKPEPREALDAAAVRSGQRRVRQHASVADRRAPGGRGVL